MEAVKPLVRWCASTLFAALLMGAISACAFPSREILEQADYGPPPEDYVHCIYRYFQRRHGRVPEYLDCMGPMKAWWRKSGFFSTDYRFGWEVRVRTREGWHRFYFRGNAIRKVKTPPSIGEGGGDSTTCTSVRNGFGSWRGGEGRRGTGLALASSSVALDLPLKTVTLVGASLTF